MFCTKSFPCTQLYWQNMHMTLMACFQLYLFSQCWKEMYKSIFIFLLDFFYYHYYNRNLIVFTVIRGFIIIPSFKRLWNKFKSLTLIPVNGRIFGFEIPCMQYWTKQTLKKTEPFLSLPQIFLDCQSSCDCRKNSQKFSIFLEFLRIFFLENYDFSLQQKELWQQ